MEKELLWISVERRISEFQIGRSYEDELRQLNGNIRQRYVSGTLAVRKRKSGRICIKWKILKTKKACLLTGNLMKVRETLSRTIRNTDSMISAETSCVADGNRNSTNQQVIIHFKDNHGHEKKYKLQKYFSAWLPLH